MITPHYDKCFLSGVISAIKRPDVDVQKEYVLTVIARDRAVKSKSKFGETPSSAQVLIQVRRVHRNAPFIAVHTLPSMFAESHPDTLASVTCSTDVDLTVVEESQESHNLNKSKTGNNFHLTSQILRHKSNAFLFTLTNDLHLNSHNNIRRNFKCSITK